MKKMTVLILLLFAIIVSSNAQTKKQKNFFPIWTFQHKNVNIHGLSLGFFSPQKSSTRTNGIKLELIGLGFLTPMVPQFPSENNRQYSKEKYLQRTNGISLSATGSICDCITNGLSIGFVGHLVYEVNGVSLSTINLATRHKGFQMGVHNFASLMNGVQFGFFNTSEKTKGIQIGLWNTNEKRSLPIINWNFKSKNK